MSSKDHVEGLMGRTEHLSSSGVLSSVGFGMCQEESLCSPGPWMME